MRSLGATGKKAAVPAWSRSLAGVLLFLLLLLTTGLAQDIIPEATPEEMGMDAAVLDQMVAELEELTAAGRIPGATVLISRRGRLVFKTNVGFERDDMLFQIFSMSKIVVTVGLFTLVQEGTVALDDPIDKFIPEIRGAPRQVMEDRYSKPYWYKTRPAQQPITVHHLLTHTAGLTYGWTNTTCDELYRQSFAKQYLTRSGSLENLILAILDLPLLADPGDLWYYSLSFDALGYLLERISGKPIDAFLQERVFEPLGMVDTAFFVPEDKRDRLAPMLDLTQPGSFVSRIHKYIASDLFEDPALKLPGTGLITTAQDFFRLMQMLYNGGELGGRRFVREDLVERIFRDQLPEKLKPYEINYEKKHNHGYTYGAQIQLVESALAPKGEVSWGGQGCTKFMLSRERELAMVAFSQKNPLPNEVEDIVRKYAYASQKDLPPLKDSAEFRALHRTGELMDMVESALPDVDADALLGDRGGGDEEEKEKVEGEEVEAVSGPTREEL